MRFPLPNDYFKTTSQFPIHVSLADSDRTVFKDFARSTLIYIRNLGLKTQDLGLSFDGLSYDEKQQFMTQYMFGDISCKIKELDESWAKAIRQICQCDSQELNSIFSADEQSQFASTNRENLSKAMQNIKSGVIQSTQVPDYMDDRPKFPANAFNILETYGKYLEFIPWDKSITASSCSLTAEQRNQVIQSSKSAILLYGQTTSLSGMMNMLVQSLK